MMLPEEEHQLEEALNKAGERDRLSVLYGVPADALEGLELGVRKPPRRVSKAQAPADDADASVTLMKTGWASLNRADLGMMGAYGRKFCALVAEQMENEIMCEVYATALRVLTNGTMSMPCRAIATSASETQAVAMESATHEPFSTMFTTLAGKRPGQQRRGTTARVGTAVAAAAGAGAGAPICAR